MVWTGPLLMRFNFKNASRTRLLPSVAKMLCALSIFVCCAPFTGFAIEKEIPADRKIRIAFAGDSTADGLWGGISDFVAMNSCLKSQFELGRFAKDSTGLTRPDRYNWPEQIKKIVEKFKPDLFVISFGLNDRQPLVERTESRQNQVIQLEAPEWPEKYRGNALEVLKNATVEKAGVVWMGLAVMRDRVTNIDAQLKNKIFADAVAEFHADNVQFVEPWKLNSSGTDVFATYAPDFNKRIVQIRTSDGEHFTSAGDLIVAHYVFPKIVENLANSGKPIEERCANRTNQ
jgi:uncharacterized protein